MILQTKNGSEWKPKVGFSDKLRVANILDPVHDDLDQKIFKGTDPRPQKVSFIWNHFMNQMKQIIPAPEAYFDLYLTGSLTTYQFSDNSDCDISVFPHYDELIPILGVTDANQVRRLLVPFVINKCDGVVLPGTTHPIQHFIVADGISLSQMYHQGLRSAWSFQDQKWIVPPEKDRAHDVSIELPLMFLRARAIADKMRIALDHDTEAAKRLFSRIHKKRSEDQKRGLGDFSESNIIYKYLLNQGLFDRLRDIGIYIANTKTAGNKIRAFIAFELPETATNAIVNWMEQNAPEGVHPQPAQNLHQTLAFLGDIDEEIVPQLQQVMAKFDPSTVTITGPTEYRELDKLGMLVFTDQGGQELWSALNAELKELIGYEPQFSPWLSHSTVWYFGADNKPNLQPTDLPTMSFQPSAIHLMKSERQPQGGALYVKVADADDKPMQVIYDFQADRIILGSYAEAGKLPNTIIIGTYHQNQVTLNQHAHQWLNTAYFKKLWARSFPTYPLNSVSIMHNEGPKRIAEQLSLPLYEDPSGQLQLELHPSPVPGYEPPPESEQFKPNWERQKVRYKTAFVYIGEPYHQLLANNASEHSEYIGDWIDKRADDLIYSNAYTPEQASNEAYKEWDELPVCYGHVGEEPTGLKGDGDIKFQNWVVFYSGFKDKRKEQPLRDEAMAAIRGKYPNAQEGDDYVYDGGGEPPPGWYGYGL
jgi:2'-5' RNA ligase